MPSSRAKAQMVREFEVTVESPQNHMAMAASNDMAPSTERPKLCWKDGDNGGDLVASGVRDAQRGRHATYGEGEREQQQVSNRRRNRHRVYHPPRNPPLRVDRLLGGVSRGIIPGEGPLRLKQAQQESPPVGAASSLGGLNEERDGLFGSEKAEAHLHK